MGLLLAFGVACSTPAASDEPKDHLESPSLHVMVNSEAQIPLAGTFAWGPKLFKAPPAVELDRAAVDQRLRQAIRAKLQTQGFELADPGAPATVHVGYAVAVDASLDEAELNEAHGDEFRFSFELDEPGQQRTYREGVLVIDVVGASTQTLLWRGALLAQISMGVDESAKVARTTQAVDLLLDAFPAPPQTP